MTDGDGNPILSTRDLKDERSAIRPGLHCVSVDGRRSSKSGKRAA